ncbi:hypothetical protein [Micromonospora sp. WMMD987]|uniref:hypothetical protein n=1 Tax=Micromonospora sp. WMMD987 TaxID=3016089 RepID=UPI00249CAD54|nr:hypothetical protein [Micromonospora sp. WMMD987]WFE96658.1 hypothetical protein O7612_07130 [Micromonospora sp. WMMD987]
MRMLLDTNVWSHLSRQGLGEEFYRLIKRRSVNVVTAPASLLELLRTPQGPLRRESVKLIGRSRWTRLPTEAESEVRELVAEVARLRKGWLLSEPLRGRYAALASDWRHGIWRAARRDDASVIDYAKRHAVEARAGISQHQREQSARWRDEGFLRGLADTVVCIDGTIGFPRPEDESWFQSQGWRPGTHVEAWRLEALQHIHQGLFMAKRPYAEPTTGSAYADWFETFVDLDAVSAERAEFGELLLYEMAASAIPRAWMRWALGLVQHAVKKSSGNAVDAQLSTYLYDADLFFTSDKIFQKLLESIYPKSPIPFAVPVYLNPAGNLCSDIEELMEDAVQ